MCWVRWGGVAVALALGGCGAGVQYIMDEYRGVPVQEVVMPEDTYRVFDKPTENKMMLTPSLGATAGMGVAQGLTFNSFDATPPKPVFEAAAAQFLRNSGRSCELLETYLLVKPQWEVKYRCTAPGAPAPQAARRRR
jgi:hypothetical protein